MDALYKKDKKSLASIVEEYYRVVDTKGTPKGVLVSMILEAEFGKDFSKNPEIKLGGSRMRNPRARCPKCGKFMTMREPVSMGPGYREWEDLTPYYSCSNCEKDFEISQVKEFNPTDRRTGAYENPGTNWHVDRANELEKKEWELGKAGKSADAFHYSLLVSENKRAAEESRKRGMNPKKGQKKCPICGRFSDYQWQAGGWYCPKHKFFFPSDLRNPGRRENPISYGTFTNYYGGIRTPKMAREYAEREKDPEFKKMFLRLAGELERGVRYMSFINESGQLAYKEVEMNPRKRKNPTYRIGFTKYSPNTGQMEYDAVTITAPSADKAVKKFEKEIPDAHLYGIETVRPRKRKNPIQSKSILPILAIGAIMAVIYYRRRI